MVTAILDFSLDEAQRCALEARGLTIKTAEAHFDGREHKTRAGNVRALTVRPFIPHYFPGYDVYLWIDGDAWVQDASAIDDYVSVAREGKLAITRISAARIRASINGSGRASTR